MRAISQLFCEASVICFSDHCLALIDIVGKRRIKKTMKDFQFRFNTNWIFEESCENCIKDFWDSTWISTSMKFEGLGLELNKWANNHQRCKKHRVDC